MSTVFIKSSQQIIDSLSSIYYLQSSIFPSHPFKLMTLKGNKYVIEHMRSEKYKRVGGKHSSPASIPPVDQQMPRFFPQIMNLTLFVCKFSSIW